MNKETPPESPDSILIKNVSSTIAKGILYVGLFITAGYIFNSCGVSKEDMQECRSVCGDRGMISVSAWSCQCGWKSSSADFVIPSLYKSNRVQKNSEAKSESRGSGKDREQK